MGRLGNVLKFGDFSSGAVIQLFTMNSLRNPNSPVALQPGIILTTPATTSAAYIPPATDSHEIVDPHSATCLVLCDATGHRRCGGPIRDPPGISVPLRRTHDRNLPRDRLPFPHCRAAARCCCRKCARSDVPAIQSGTGNGGAGERRNRRGRLQWHHPAARSLSSTPGQYPDNTASVFPAHVLPVFGRWSAYRRIPTAAVLCRFHHGYQGCNHG